MGILRMGPPEELVLLLQKHYYCSTFVETGTFKGKTSVWASKHFEKIFTVEYSKALFDDVVTQYGHIENINFLFGDSRLHLKNIVNKLSNSSIFWLDAHWHGKNSYGSEDQCPIIDEIRIIRSSPINHIILIDDASLFLSPPPIGHNINQWPTIDQLLGVLHNKFTYTVIIEDVIISVPLDAMELLVDYCQKINTNAMNNRMRPTTKNGISLIVRGIRIILRNVINKIKGL